VDSVRECVAIALIVAAMLLVMSATTDIVNNLEPEWIVIKIWSAIMLATTSIGLMTHKLKR
jgi:hypothetical protein